MCRALPTPHIWILLPASSATCAYVATQPFGILFPYSYDLVTYNPTRLIYEAVKRIPKGCVATYAQVAELAGNKKMCRAVGNALHKNPNPDEIPCYRVVNAKGELSGAFAFGGADEQANRLRADGIEVIDGRVDLDKYGIRIVDDVIYTKTTVEPLT